MSFDLTILTRKIDGLKESYDNGNFADALVTALNTGNGLLQQRVFSDNSDIEGNSFGKYVGSPGSRKSQDREVFRALFGTDSKTDRKRIKANANEDLTSYQRKRVNKGRQILKKDLEFTGGLRRAIETVVEGEHAAVLAFDTLEMAEIAHGQEKQIARINGRGVIKIFGFNYSEKEQVIEQGADLIKEILK